MALSTSTGEVFGGHLAPCCIVRTTAEVLLALLNGSLPVSTMH
ncbi:DNA-binding protein [Polaromonas sp. P1(28)-13]|nr:DNA-binding protein [Polaromonas sp. P1-6]UUZ67177.1 DNA-binding protein [Polaromonas sp. P2-4]UUZ74820.1 DNA-binding protein [Polaromonas sp. P1(28)-13]